MRPHAVCYVAQPLAICPGYQWVRDLAAKSKAVRIMLRETTADTAKMHMFLFSSSLV